MMRALLLTAVAVAVSIPAAAQRRRGSDLAAPPLAGDAAEKRILTTLENIVSNHQTYLSVPMADGRALRLLAQAAGAKTIVEIGTSIGYSGLWLCLALQKTGGRLTTFELDHERAEAARGHFREAGVENLVTVVEGDAHQQIARLKGPIDLVFIDADKEGYVDYLRKLLPLVRPGGLILAHNIDTTPDYVRAVTTDPALETIFYMQGNSLGVTVKK